MPRNIKQVSHDLLPVITTICDLGEDLNTLMQQLYATLDKLDAEQRDYFETALTALESLTESGTLALQYLQEVDDEADQAGIEKSY